MSTLHISFPLLKAFGSLEERQTLLKLHYLITTSFERCNLRHGHVSQFRFEKDKCVLVLCGNRPEILHKILNVYITRLSQISPRQGVALLGRMLVTEGLTYDTEVSARVSELSLPSSLVRNPIHQHS